jgi:pimeloyl-ACP methyl ester carboxylesterase
MLGPAALELFEVTLIFLHGAGGSPLSWHLQTHHFKDSLAIGLPGHPEGPGFRTIEEYTAWLGGHLQRNAVREPVLVGHSMGGAIAIEYALHSSSLKGLVLVGTGARLRVRQDLASKIMENYEEASKFIARMSVSANCDPIVIERIAKEMLKVNAEVTYGDFLACNGFDRMNDVENISVRTLVICGADDQLTPTKYSQYLHEKIRNSRLVVIPGAGHSVMLEKHREFNEALEVFLASL